MITHLEPDILECSQVGLRKHHYEKKLVEVTEVQSSYCRPSKLMLSQCCTQYVSKFENLSRGHRTGKEQFSFQSLRKAMHATLPHSKVAVVSHLQVHL